MTIENFGMFWLDISAQQWILTSFICTYEIYQPQGKPKITLLKFQKNAVSDKYDYTTNNDLE